MRAQSPHNEKLIPAKKAYTVQVGDTLIHSRYDPESEAEKYIASLHLQAFSFFVLLEPGLGYLAAAIGKQFPQAQIITLHCSPFFAKEDHSDSFSWNPALPEALEDFLERNLEDADASEIKLIEWKPSINVYGKSCLDLAAAAVGCIKRISAGKKTVRNFGRRWIRNALRNLETSNLTVNIACGSVPVLVCAAGPGLEDSLDTIASLKQSSAPPFLVAVSSAVPALLYRGIMPNMIVGTDGGTWALFHLTESCRYYSRDFFAGKKPCIAAALTAYLPSQISTWPLLFFRDGSLWQEILVRESEAIQGTNLVFPQRGTVSVSALDLAFAISGGNVYLSGLDFAHRDLLTHARPYAFEPFFEQKASRTQPRCSQIFARETMIRGSGSLGIYASWFFTHISSYPKRLYTLGPSVYGLPSRIPSVNEAGKKIHIETLNTRPGGRNARAPGKKHLAGSLLKALDNPLYSDRICKELSELLITEKPVEKKETVRLVKSALLEFV